MKKFTKFSSVKNIWIYLKVCIEKEKSIINEIDNLNTKDNDTRSVRKQLKKELKKFKTNIVLCYKLLQEYTTFERNIFLEFLKEYLSLINGSEYILLKGVDDIAFSTLFNVPYSLNLYDKKYNIIISASNYRLLKSLSPFNVVDIHDFFSSIVDDYYFYALDKKNYSLLDSFDITKELESKSSMSIIINELIDLKLKNPDMSDKERLERVLLDMKNSVNKYSIKNK